MLIPVALERLPVRLQITVLSAKGLPVMNKSINSCDAFVEIRFGEFLDKTEVVTSLFPVWENQVFEFDTDEKQLAEELIQFKVMDHDTYSANDAIGRVHLDCNQIIERMRMLGQTKVTEIITQPIYDSINGNRGELTLSVFIHALIPYKPKNYVQICTGIRMPSDQKVDFVHGLVSELKTARDPDYEWLDKIRSPRATNEARLQSMREMMRSTAISLANKAAALQCNYIFGYYENIDIEGSRSDFITIRAYGTAVKMIPESCESVAPDLPHLPITSVGRSLKTRQKGIGAIVAARSIHIFEPGEDAEQIRKGWWHELRLELHQQAQSLKCNLIIGYSETTSVHEGVVLMGCSGTAIVTDVKKRYPEALNDVDRKSSVPITSCEAFHCSYTETASKEGAKSLKCHTCKSATVPDVILSTAPVPSSIDYVGAKSFIQTSISKKLTVDPSESEEFARELSNNLPFADHELFNSVVNELRTSHPHGNSVFEFRFTYSIADDVLVCVGTGVVVKLLALAKEAVISPSIPSVLSFSSLQKAADPRRFSWVSVKEAIRFRSSHPTSITLKIMNLKPTSAFDEDNGSQGRNRIRLNTFVNKLKKRQMEKDMVTRAIFERQISVSIGFHEHQIAGNAAMVAGVYLNQSMNAFLLTKRQAENYPVLFRWSDVFVREDLCTSIKDPVSVDTFVCNALEEHIAHVKNAATLNGQWALSNLTIACPQFTISREHAHIIFIISCDIHAIEC